MESQIATVPVLTGEAWERFERLRIEAEKRRGTAKLSVSKSEMEAIIAKAKELGTI